MGVASGAIGASYGPYSVSIPKYYIVAEVLILYLHSTTQTGHATQGCIQTHGLAMRRQKSR